MSFTSKISNSEHRNISIDLGQSGLNILLTDSSPKNCFLKLPSSNFYSVPSANNQLDKIESLVERGFTQSKTIILGMNSDPFYQAFDQTLMLLKVLADSPFLHLHIQTRSPLVLLASPILKALRGRVSVSVAIETVDDNLSSELTPLLPKPSERILTLRTLTSLGIPTFAQICPITSARAKARDTKLLAAVGAMASYVKLLSGLDAIGFTFSSKHLYRSNYELCRQINHSLNKIMPKRVIWIKDLIATTNQAAA